MVDLRFNEPIPLSEVARMFKVTGQTVRKWTRRKTNRLEAFQMAGSGRWYTSMEAIQACAIPRGESVVMNRLREADEQAMQELKERHGF